MTRYTYRALGADGITVEGEMEADSQGSVVQQLQSSGLYPITTEPASAGRDRRGLRSRAGDISARELATFTAELATMIEAGLTLDDALATLNSPQLKPGVKRLIERLRRAIQSGQPLSVAIENDPHAFPAFYPSLIRAGETAGELAPVLSRLAAYLEHRERLRAAVISALIYPAALLLISGISLLILLLFVVPRFESIFQDLGGALPWSTQFVIAAANAIRDYGWVAGLLLLVTPPLLSRLLADPVRRRTLDQVLAATPLLGPLIEKMETARITRTLGTLLENGVPMLTALTLVGEGLRNSRFADAVQNMIQALEQGQNLARAMLATGIFSALAVQLAEVGDSTGQMPKMMLKIADIHDTEVETSTRRLITLLEPVLILIMGVTVGFIIVAILLAILSLNELIL